MDKLNPKEDTFEKNLVVKTELWKKIEKYADSVNLTCGIILVIIIILLKNRNQRLFASFLLEKSPERKEKSQRSTRSTSNDEKT